MGKRLTEAKRQHIIALYDAGKGHREIVKEAHCAGATIKPVLDAAGVIRRHGNTGREKYPAEHQGNRVCSACRAEKATNEFSMQRNKLGILVYRGECRKCGSKRARMSTMLRKFGMTSTDYDILFAEQNGLCASCGLPEWYRGKDGEIIKLSIDHNHETGKVRHLLCCRCNKALGSLQEDPELCELLKQYALRIRKEG